MQVEFNLNENDKFSPITVASAIIDKIEEGTTRTDEEKMLFLKAISEHLNVYCTNTIVN